MFQIEYRSFALNFKQTGEKKEVLINVFKYTMKFNKILELGLPSLDKSTPSSLSTSWEDCSVEGTVGIIWPA